MVRKVTTCRVCKRALHVKVLTFGPTPLANAFLTKRQLDAPELHFPLDVYLCTNCSLLQLGHVVSPVVLFRDYVYVSSTSSVFMHHFEHFAKEVGTRFSLNADSLVVDIGSNDGILLKPFKVLGADVLGIDPAVNIARVARKEGIPTLSKFFSVKLAKEIVEKKGKAKIVTATNVFAHIDDLDEVIEGLDVLLARDGVFIMEAPYLVDFLQKRYFDLVYHEHLSYWAVAPLVRLFKRHNIQIFDVQKVNVHGGSIRVFVEKDKGPYRVERRVETFLQGERRMKLGDVETYLDFGSRILENKIKLATLLSRLKAQGKRIAAYGAPAKGNTLLNFFSIGGDILDYVVDDNTWKQGLYTPGTRIPVVSPDTLDKKPVHYLLILAWNFAESIMAAHRRFQETGGAFIIPVPRPKIVSLRIPL